MAVNIIAYCGIVCSECDAYVATQQGDMDALQKMADQASAQFGITMTAEDSMCDGCLGDGRKIGYCVECGVRNCATARGVINCAHCTDYGCETLTAFHERAPSAKKTLENIRLSLS